MNNILYLLVGNQDQGVLPFSQQAALCGQAHLLKARLNWRRAISSTDLDIEELEFVVRVVIVNIHQRTDFARQGDGL